MTPRDLFHWKTYFHRIAMPALRALGPERADAALDRAGRLAAAVDRRLRRTLADSALRARRSLGARADAWDLRRIVPELAAGSLRFQARDYLLDTDDDARALARFDVEGGERFRALHDAGAGVILVGAHYGGHLSALHWLYRNRVPLRLMVQRPRHVSRALDGFFDAGGDGPDGQAGFFLRRGLGKTDCVDRLLRVRAAVRSGQVVYFAGDVPWRGVNTRPGRLLGQVHSFLAVWADLSALTGTPVAFLFCNHRPGGRFALSFETIGPIAAGSEAEAVGRFLNRLEDRIAADPADATPQLLWPCYAPSPRTSAARPGAGGSSRPSRRGAVVTW